MISLNDLAKLVGVKDRTTYTNHIIEKEDE